MSLVSLVVCIARKIESEHMERIRTIVMTKDELISAGRALRRLRRVANATLGDVVTRTSKVRVSFRDLSLAESGKRPLTPKQQRAVMVAIRSMMSHRLEEIVSALREKV
jgi:hypothetical protein